MEKISRILRERLNKKRRKVLMNKEFTIISSNCYGGFFYHDLEERFLSPFINLWMEPKDYIKYLQNMKYYMQQELRFEEMKEYPVGHLDNLVIYFQHYKSNEEAYLKWQQRSKRMQMDNLFLIFTERDGCTFEDLLEFDKLPYKNKVVFTHKEYPEIQSSFQMKGFEKEGEVGNCYEFLHWWSGKKRYDDFPFVKWINGDTKWNGR